MLRIWPSALCLGVILFQQYALAHGGGLDAQGCHTDKGSSERHCHNGSKASAVEEKTAEPASLEDSLPTMSKQERVIKIQHGLKALGFYQGAISGRVTLETFNAIRRAQENLGLPLDGQASADMLMALEEEISHQEIAQNHKTDF